MEALNAKAAVNRGFVNVRGLICFCRVRVWNSALPACVSFANFANHVECFAITNFSIVCVVFTKF